MTIAVAILWIVAAYLSFGFLYALIFVTILAGRLDPGVQGTSLGFRLLLLPGATALWPLLFIVSRTRKPS